MTPQEQQRMMRESTVVPSSIVESWLAEKDALIERLRERIKVCAERYVSRETAGDMVADERRRTAEEIKRRADATLAPSSHERTAVIRICDEVAGDAVQDLAAPSNGSDDQKPTSPGATDPRVEAASNALVGQDYSVKAVAILAAADAADRAADPPWIRVRCDETTKGTVYDWIVDGIPHNDVGLRHDINLVFAALVALRGEQ